MSIIAELWSRLSHAETVLYPSFMIPPSRLVGHELAECLFRTDESYIELVICEQFLRDRREYWNEYQPLTLVLTELIYDRRRRSFPFVVGPALLKGLEQLEGNERVRYRNTRVVGPTPYQGDEVVFFLGLFRVKTRDWAQQALGILERFSKAFDCSRLSSYLSISKPLLDSIEDFLGMGDQMQYRLGQRDSFTDPKTHTQNVLASGYFVIIRSDEKVIKKKDFWVKENQLYVGSKKTSLQPYRENDYVLYRVVCSKTRNDITTFPFHHQWEYITRYIWDGHLKEAKEAHTRLIALLRRSPDLIRPQKNKLQLYYTEKFIEEYQAYKKSRDPKLSIFEDGTDSFNTSIEQMEREHADKDMLNVMEIGRDYFLVEAKNRLRFDGPVFLTETDVQKALNSPILNRPSVQNINPFQLSTALSIGPPVVGY